MKPIIGYVVCSRGGDDWRCDYYAQGESHCFSSWDVDIDRSRRWVFTLENARQWIRERRATRLGEGSPNGYYRIIPIVRRK